MPASDTSPREPCDLIFGCGYLGQRVARRWRDAGRTVAVVTRSPARAEAFRQQGLVPYIADVCVPESLSHLPDADRVLYAVGYDRSGEHAQEEVFVNGLSRVLQALGSRFRRFVYISSTSVYGQNNGSWVDESSVCEPVQPGGKHCLAAERLLTQAVAGQDRAAAILRLAGIYGPQRLLSRSADLKSGVPISGRPDAWLNLIHVDDAVEAVERAAQIESPAPVYVIADDQPISRGDYYRRLADLVGAPSPHFDGAQPARRGSGGLNKRCSNRRMKTELQVRLRYPTIESGLPAALADAG